MDEAKTFDFLGITVTITRSAGADEAPVVFVDTDDTINDGPSGPLMRIRLNDEPVFEGAPYIPKD